MEKKKKTGERKESIEPNKAKPKKPYSPPRFMVLTPDEAKKQMTERALPGDVAAQQLLREAHRLATSGSNGQSPIPGRAKGAPAK